MRSPDFLRFHRAHRGALRLGAVALAAAQICIPAGTQAQTTGAFPSVFRQGIGPTDYAANARVARILVELDRNGVPADGQSPVALTVRLFGADGQPLRGTHWATIEASGGRLQLPGARTDELGQGRLDADRVTAGTQLRVDNGVAQVTLLAPAEPMEVQLRVTAGSEEAAGSVQFLPELREMLAVGLVEGVVHFGNRATTRLAQPRAADVFEQEIRRFEQQFNNGRSSYAYRAAFFLKGMIKGEYLLTAAYDSDKDTRERLLRDIQPEQMYPVYGDASLRGFDARSISPLYVRIDKGRHYALFGDFSTGAGFSQQSAGGATASLAQRQLGNFNRTLNGLRLHGENDRYHANVYASHDNLKQVIEEFAGRGVSGPYAVSNNTGVQNSEKIELLVRDRNQPAVILSATPLVRFTDYSFEPFSGRVLFTQPVPSVDANLNPVSVRITYEVEQGGDSFWLAGADAQWRITDALELGGSLVRDQNPLAPFRLGSANLGLRLGERTRLVLEVARTTSNVNTNTVNTYVTPALAAQVGEVSGNAARADLRHDGERWQLHAFAARSDAGFNNQAAAFSGGRSDAGVRVDTRVSEQVQLYAEALRADDDNSGARRQGAQLGLRYQASERLTVDLAVRAVHEEGSANGNGLSVAAPVTAPLGAGATGSLLSGNGGGFFGNGAGAIDPATGLPIVNNGSVFPTTSAAGGGLQNLDATTARLGLRYQATERLALRGELELGIDGDHRRRAAVGADYQLGERTRAYGRLESQSGLSSLYAISPSSRSNVFVAGLETDYMRGGQVFSEVRMRDAINAQDLHLASGVRNVWDVAEGWRLSTTAERLAILAGTGQQATALTAGVDWSADPLWRASGRLEWRRTGDTATVAGADSYLSTLMLARKLDRDWTLLARNYLLVNDNRSTGDLLQNRFQIGAAYRDTDTNRINALARYEYKLENDASVSPRNRRAAHVVSTHADYHPSRPWWWTGRIAAKHVREEFDGIRDSYSALLLGGRVTYDMTESWSASFMTSLLVSPQGSARQWAQGVELGYQVQTNLWLALGVNWSGFVDRDLVGTDYTRRGIYLRLRWKFDEDLFRRDQPATNPALAR
ncbi:MAG: hypothetical protein JNM97_01810 [Rhodoferax sp.]|jgi:hypothetical protein|nr:hypothetical protein [Rhodoferax sp.]